MKYLKTYEQVNKPYKIGDYAIISIVFTTGDKVSFEEYILVKILDIQSSLNDIIVQRQDKSKHVYHINHNNIDYWSENIEELKTIIAANKYNL